MNCPTNRLSCTNGVSKQHQQREKKKSDDVSKKGEEGRLRDLDVEKTIEEEDLHGLQAARFSRLVNAFDQMAWDGWNRWWFPLLMILCVH